MALVGSLTSLEMAQQLEQARSVIPELQPFTTAESLLEGLTCEDVNIEGRDAIYRALIRGVQARVAWAALGRGVLWCGLWPGLDTLHRRQARYFAHDPDELISLISIKLTALIDKIDLRRVRRVAATLIRSTAREVTRAHRRHLAAEARRLPVTGAPSVGALTASLHPVTAAHSALGIPPGLTIEAQVGMVHQWLRRAVGDDAALFLAAAVFGVSSQQLADQLGLSHEAVRKRLERIRTRLAKTLSRPQPLEGLKESDQWTINGRVK